MTKVTSWNGNPILKWLLAIHGLIIWTPNQKKIFGPPRATPKKYLPYLRGCLNDVWLDSFLLHEIVGTWGPRKLAANSLCETAETAVHLVGTANGVFFWGGGFWWILGIPILRDTLSGLTGLQPVNHAIKMLLEAAPIHHDFLQPSINWSIKQPLIAFGLVRFYPIPCKELQGDNNHPNTNHRWATNKNPGLTFHWILVVQYGSL